MRSRGMAKRLDQESRRRSTCSSQLGCERRRGLREPRVENSEYLISFGARTATSNSLNDALAIANSDMMRWLVEEYGIEPIAAHLLIGHQAKYDVVALSGVMAVKIPKRVLLPQRF